VFLGSYKILNANGKRYSKIKYSTTFKYTWTNTQRKYSTQKLAQQGQIKANQEQMRNDKKISEAKKALTL
jgi:competence protein ComGC